MLPHPSATNLLRGRAGGTDTPRSFDSTVEERDESTMLLDSHSRDEGADSDALPKNYGTAASRQHDEIIRSLPTRLARSASIARKVERKQRRSAQWKSFNQRAKYYVPVLQWLPSYSLGAFVGDATAAFTMTSLIVPQAMSYATSLAGIDPVNGLFGAAIPALVYSVLGTCRQLSVGPEASLSLITGQAIATFLAEEAHAHPDMTPAAKVKIAMMISTIITFEAGIITFALGIFRLGFIDSVLSRALLRGFITAIGAVIFCTQLIPILGLEHALAAVGGAESAVDKLKFVVQSIGSVHRLTFMISIVALSILILSKIFKARLARRRGFGWLNYVPEVLFVVIASTVLTGACNWDRAGVNVLGKVSPGEAKLGLPFTNTYGYLGKCIGTSAVIAILGFLDSIVGAKDCASKYDYPISPNRELVAIGAANVAASFVSGTLAGYGSITRSRLAGSTGATTQMTSLLTGGMVLFVTYFLLGFLFYLPKCILSVIICVVVFSILAEAPHDVMFYWKMEAWVDFALMTLTFLLTFFVNAEVGIVVSVAVSMMLCIKQSSAMRIKILGRVPGTQYYEPLEDDDDDGLFPGEEIPGILIVRLRDASLTFANAGALKERLRRLERYGKGKHHPSDQPRRAEASVVIFHLVDVEDIDASALQLISEVVEAYASRSVMVYWTGVHPIALARLALAGVLDLSGDASHVQPNVQSALNSLNETMLSVHRSV